MAVTDVTPEEAGKILRLADEMVVRPHARDRLGLISRTLTPENVRNAITSAERGDLTSLQEVYMKMESTDARYAGLVRSLRSASLAVPFRIQRSRALGVPESLGDEMVELVRFQFEEVIPPSEVSKIATRAFVRGVVPLIYVYEMQPGPRGEDRWFMTEIRQVPGSRLKWDTTRDSDRYGELGYISEDGGDLMYFSDLPRGKYRLVHDDAEEGYWDIAGAARICLQWFMLKYYTTQWWAQYNESFGEPYRVAFVDGTVKPEERATVRSFLSQLGRAMYGIFPSGVDLKLLSDSRSGTIDIHDRLITRANQEMTIALHGQTQTSDGGSGGSYAKAVVQERVRDEVVDTVIELENSVYESIVHNIIALNFGTDWDIHSWKPRAKRTPIRQRDRKEALDVIDGARKLVEIPKYFVYDSLSIPEPLDGEEVLEKPAPPPAFGQPGEDDDGAEDERDGGMMDRSVAEGG